MCARNNAKKEFYDVQVGQAMLTQQIKREATF
jgi:hypothetical protein